MVEKREQEWVVGAEYDDGHKYHMCSGCKAFANAYRSAKEVCEWLTPYCPYCGAPMRNSGVYQWFEEDGGIQ